MSTFLEVFFAFVAGGITLWGLLQVEKYVKREPAGELTAQAGLRAMSTQLQQAAVRLSKPTVAPPPAPLPPPRPTPQSSPQPWPYAGKHALTDDAEETSAMPVITPKAL